MAAVATPADGQTPNPTVYVRNLDERVKLKELDTALRDLFSEYGTIVDLVAKRNLKAKGQAFIVFENAESAQNAIEEIQGFPLFDKPMELAFARTKSDATVKMNASEEDFEAHKRHRMAEKERKLAMEAQEEQAKGRMKRPAQEGLPSRAGKAQKGEGAGLKSTAASAVVPDEYLPPNKTLFVQNVPDEYDSEALSAIFGRFEGFREVRLVPGRRGLAFVEYEAETGAISAKENTAGMALGQESKPIKVTYQRQ